MADFAIKLLFMKIFDGPGRKTYFVIFFILHCKKTLSFSFGTVIHVNSAASNFTSAMVTRCVCGVPRTMALEGMVDKPLIVNVVLTAPCTASESCPLKNLGGGARATVKSSSTSASLDMTIRGGDLERERERRSLWIIITRWGDQLRLLCSLISVGGARLITLIQFGVKVGISVL